MRRREWRAERIWRRRRICCLLRYPQGRQCTKICNPQSILRDVDCKLPENGSFELLSKQRDVMDERSVVGAEMVVLSHDIGKIGLQREDGFEHLLMRSSLCTGGVHIHAHVRLV